jgi:ubiquitin carboxyl-terminal hydrolase 25/28
MQMEKMREALQVIAEVRNSERLRQFLVTGLDRMSWIIPPPRCDG